MIRWDGTGVCQIWDNAVPTGPFPSNYKTVGRSMPTYMDALAAKDKLFHAAKCTL